MHTQPRSRSVVAQEASQSLAETLRQADGLNLHCSTTVMETLQDGWVRVSDLHESSAAWVNGVLDQIMAQYAAPNRHVAAAFFMGWYAWYVATPAIACYLLAQHVPNLAPDSVALRFGGPNAKQPMEIAFLDHRSVAQPITPFAGGSAHTRLPLAENPRRDVLRLQIEGHMGMMIEWVASATRLGRRGLWNHVADVCAEVFLRIGEQRGQREETCAEALALIQHPRSPMRFSKTAYLTLESADQCQTFRLRGSCCMYYKVPTGTHCNTCPLLKGGEREQRLRQWMAHTHT